MTGDLSPGNRGSVFVIGFEGEPLPGLSDATVVLFVEKRGPLKDPLPGIPLASMRTQSARTEAIAASSEFPARPIRARHRVCKKPTLKFGASGPKYALKT